MKTNLKKLFTSLLACMLIIGIFSACMQGTESGGNGAGSGSGNGNNSENNSGNDNYQNADIGNFIPGNTSVEQSTNMAIGWNLGNALDASSCDDWAYKSGLSMEYSWLSHKQATSQKLIKAVKAAGFKTIRIPISWHNHMSKTDEIYKIDDDWMNRVQTLVDWSLAEGMCVIINIHHDNLTETQIKSNPGFCISTNSDIQEKSKAFIENVWTQIAGKFKDYDNNLVFELLNEPRCVGTDYEWGFWGANAGKDKTYNNIITAYEQVALDVIRASGGKNATRFVMCPAYAASPDFLSSYSLPTDSATDKLLISTHAYTPSNFALEGNMSDYDANKTQIESSISSIFDNLASKYVKKGIGVVMGEASASDKDNLSSREKWTKFYFTKAQASGIPVVLWDNEQAVAMGATAGGENHGYFNRETCKQTWPSLIQIMMESVYGEVPDNGENGNDSIPPETDEIAYTINYEGINGEADFSVDSDWVSIEIEFESLVEGMQFAIKSDALKEDHGDWKEYYTAYKQPSSEKTTIVLADVLAEIKNANPSPIKPITKIAIFGIQNTKNASNAFTIVKSTVTKKDNTVEDITPVGDGWCATVIK